MCTCMEQITCHSFVKIIVFLHPKVTHNTHTYSATAFPTMKVSSCVSCFGPSSVTSNLGKTASIPKIEQVICQYIRHIHEQSLKKASLDVVQSHPLHRMHFVQYQASSAALGLLQNGSCYFMYNM